VAETAARLTDALHVLLDPRDRKAPSDD
jgi:hypothetical protein